MRILHVNTADRPGGAELIACKLVQGQRQRGHKAWLAAGQKLSNDDFVFSLGERATAAEKIRASLMRHYRKRRGHELSFSPVSWRLPELAPEPPDILHAHNLHGLKGYFDLRALPSLSERFPFFVTMQDSWLLSGHCAHSFDCDRWKTGCGECPDLTIYPSIRVDGTAFNWKLRRDVFARSRLYVATPCQWLMDKVEESILAPGIIEARVIPNGVDLDVFKPANQQEARKRLSLPMDARMILFAASALKENVFKDHVTLRDAIARIAENMSDVVFLALGAEGEDLQIGKARVRFTGFAQDHNEVASYFQAADCFLHAAKADTYPNVILEALAAGCPVVATAVAGIPEQIVDGETGFLVPKGDAAGMAERALKIIQDIELRKKLGEEAGKYAATHFGIDRQVETYLRWYGEVLSKPRAAKKLDGKRRPLVPWRIPKVSVGKDEGGFTATAIVSTYNSEEFMRGCLEDLVAQTLFQKGELEILVIDSGSPQNERAIVEEFQKRHANIAYVRTEREPLYAAWNRGIALACGRYLTNANTDDRHREDGLEIMARALDAKPEVALVYGDMAMSSSPNETFATARSPHVYRFADYDRMNLLGDGRCGPHPMWRKKLHAELGGFVEEFKVAGDYEWWVRISEKFPLLRIPEVLGLYLKRPDSIENRQLEVCQAESELIQRFYRAREPSFDEAKISQMPKAGLARVVWKWRRSLQKRLG